MDLKCFSSWQDAHFNLDKDIVEGNNLLVWEMHDLTENANEEGDESEIVVAVP